jgi:hypothetical protein
MLVGFSTKFLILYRPAWCRIGYHFSKEVTMIEFTDEQVSVLKQGYPVRASVTGLGADVVVVLAARQESTEVVLQDALDEIREKPALSQLGGGAAVSWKKKNPY